MRSSAGKWYIKYFSHCHFLDLRDSSPDEEQNVGIVVAKVSATDLDEMNTSNSEISFSITSIIPVLAPGVTQNPVNPLPNFVHLVFAEDLLLVYCPIFTDPLLVY